MAAPDARAFEVFRPLTDGDFSITEFQEPLTELAYELFREVEAVALPIPDDATYASEVSRVQQALDAAEGHYDYWPSGDFSASWRSVVSVPITEGDNPLALIARTTVKTYVQLDRSTNPGVVDEVSRAAWITSRRGVASGRRVPEKTATLLGVAGKRIGRYPARYEYEGDTEIDRQLRIALGGIMFTAERMEIEASTNLSLTRPLFDLRADNVFRLKTAKLYNIDTEPVTPLDEQLAHLGVLNELLSRARVVRDESFPNIYGA